MSHSVHISGVTAERGDVNIKTVIQGASAEQFEALLAHHQQALAARLAADLRAHVNTLLDGVHTPEHKLPNARESLCHSVWAVIAADPLVAFEMQPHLAALQAFLKERDDATTRLVALPSGAPLAQLERVMADLAAQVPDGVADEEACYLHGVALVLAFKFGRALRLLDPLARRRLEDPDVLSLAGLAAIHIAHFSVALRHFERAALVNHGDDDRTTLRRALAIAHVGACHEELLESEHAVDRCRNALALVPSSARDQTSCLVRALICNNLGYSLMTISNPSPGEQNLEEAETLFEAALGLREEAGDCDPNLAAVMFNLAEARRKLGDRAGCAEWLDRARGVLRRFAEPHILNATVSNALGIQRFDQGEFREAIDLFREARSALEASFGRESVKYVYTTYSIAQAQEALGDPEAQQTLMLARRLSIAAFRSEEHPFVRMIDEDLSTPTRRPRASFC